MSETSTTSLITQLEITRERSQIINALRFPMAAGVVFIHNNIIRGGIQTAVDSGDWNTLGVLATVISTFFGMAVPTFFFLSGFLFFNKLETWSWESYFTKLRRRVRSLLIPYMIWNAISIFGEAQNIYRLGGNLSDYFGGFTASGILRLFWCSGTYASTSTNFLGINHLTDYPADIPLWFMRDLIVMILLAPIIYWLIRKTRWLWLALLLPVYVLGFCPTIIPGFSVNTLFFFAAGAYYALSKRDFISDFSISKGLTITLSAILLVCFVISKQADWPPATVLSHLYTVFSVPATVAIGIVLFRKQLLKWSLRLASSSFFIYAAHFVSYIGFLGISRQFLLALFGEPGNEWGAILLYLVNPLLAVALCVAAYKLMARFLPKITGIICGGRS